MKLRPPSDQAFICLFVLVPTIIITIRATMFWSITDSVVPYHWFWISSRTRPVVGDFIRFRLDVPGFGIIKVVKIVRCGEGMELTTTETEYLCDGVRISSREVVDQAGRRIPTFAFSGPVPIGHYFVTGTNNDSYDSRIWGFLDRSRIKDVVIPIERILCGL